MSANCRKNWAKVARRRALRGKRGLHEKHREPGRLGWLDQLALPCIACGRVLEQVMNEADENQPYAGTAFRTHGHYGSTVFDPMDGHFLELNICDLCLVLHHDRVVIGRDRRPVTEDDDGVVHGWEDVRWAPVPWHPSSKEIDSAIGKGLNEFEIYPVEDYEPDHEPFWGNEFDENQT